MEMSYEELTARLNAIDSKIDGLLSIIGQTVATKQYEMMDIASIAEMLGGAKGGLYGEGGLLPNFGETPSGKMEWTRKEVEDWLKTDKNVLKEQYLSRAKENAM